MYFSLDMVTEALCAEQESATYKRRRALPGYLDAFEAQLGERLDEFVCGSSARRFDLDDHQRVAMRESKVAVMDRRRSARHDAASVVHGCGTGKTVLAGNLVGGSQDGKIDLEFPNDRMDIVVTSERSIALGIHRDFLDWGIDAGIWVTAKRQLDHPVLVTTIGCLQFNKDILDRRIPMDRIDLLIGDEADTMLTRKRDNVLKQLRSTMRIGLTGTETWPDGRDISDLWGPKIHRYPLSEGIKDGINVPPLWFLFEAAIDEEKLKISKGDYEPRSLQQAFKEAHVETFVSDLYRQLVPVDKRKEYPGMVKVCSRDLVHSVTAELQRQFGEDGLVVRSWTGDLTSSDNINDDVQDFLDGKVDIIVVCGMGGRGLDLPNARLMIDCDPTRSRTKLVQLHSRTSRKIREETELWNRGVRKPFSINVQVVPKASRFRALCLPDVLDAWDDAESGKPLLSTQLRNYGLIDPEVKNRSRREVRRIQERIRKAELACDLRLVERVDVYRQIDAGIPLSQRLDENGEITLEGKQCVGLHKYAERYPDLDGKTLVKKVESAQPSIPIIGYAHSCSQVVPVYEISALEELQYVQEAMQMNGRRFDEQGEVEIDGIVCVGVVASYIGDSMSFKTLANAIKEAKLPVIGVARVDGIRTCNAYDKDAVEALEYVKLARKTRHDLKLRQDGTVDVDGLECIGIDSYCRSEELPCNFIKKAAEEKLDCIAVVMSHTRHTKVYSKEAFEDLEQVKMARMAKDNDKMNARGEVSVNGVLCVGLTKFVKAADFPITEVQLKAVIAKEGLKPVSAAYSGTRPAYVYSLEGIRNLKYVRKCKASQGNVIDEHGFVQITRVVGSVDPLENVWEEPDERAEREIIECIGTDIYAKKALRGAYRKLKDAVAAANLPAIGYARSGSRLCPVYERRAVEALDYVVMKLAAQDRIKVDRIGVGSFEGRAVVTLRKYAERVVSMTYDELVTLVEDEGIKPICEAATGPRNCLDAYPKDLIDAVPFIAERLKLPRIQYDGQVNIQGTPCVTLSAYALHLGAKPAELEEAVRKAELLEIGEARAFYKVEPAYRFSDVKRLPEVVLLIAEKRKSKNESNRKLMAVSA